MVSIDSIINLLESSEINEDEVILKFREYYTHEQRHEYSDITRIVLDLYNSEEDSECETIDIVQENLSTIINHLDDQCKCTEGLYGSNCKCLGYRNTECSSFESETCCFDDKALLKSLKKLRDHIRLEVIRFQELMKKTGDVPKIKNVLEAERHRTFSKMSKLHREFVETSDKFKEYEKTLKDHDEKIKSQQTQYVTILGIFAAIVVAFIGGIAFSTSVLENIDSVSPYRLTAVIAILAFVLINVIYLMTWFILKINEKDILYPKFMKWVNATLIALVVGIIAIWFYKGDKIVVQLPDSSNAEIILENKIVDQTDGSK